MAQNIENKPMFVSRDISELTTEYKIWLSELKKRYRRAQVRAAVKVNAEMLNFYWELGRDICDMAKESKYGDGLLKNLSIDLQSEFPGDTGLSLTNIKSARRWYNTYYKWIIKSQQAVDFFGDYTVSGRLSMPYFFANVPWGQHIFITAKAKSLEEALFYLSQVCEHGWSRKELEYYYLEDFYKKHSKALTNFDKKLPVVESVLAQQMLKSPYNFEFLQMPINYSEREFEDELVKHITDFLLELGKGFSFVGRQMQLTMPNGLTYYPDLIFYHIPTHRYVVCELKVVPFTPEFVGKLNFYVSAVDHLLRGKEDNQTIGLLICRSKDDTIVEWSFEGIERPIGVAEYEKEIKKLIDELPTSKQIKENI
ncbi:MAG: DUF1016 domain-containing protein [Bacteroides sp.]|nr:DUF1016 domain-containing protein [Bacteroides sp.]